jgi:hypothetical protein
MPIDFATEDCFTLNAAPDMLARRTNGRKIHRSTIYRWVMAGVKGVKLETITIGGYRYTSTQAIGRFIAALSGRPAPDGVEAVQTPAARRRELAAVDKELDAMGVV